MARNRRKKKTIGNLEPRYDFFLNPYQDARFTRCHKCEQKMRQRKLPLVIHVDPLNPVSINKICRYCPDCDLLIAHQDEIELQLSALFAERKPELVGNDYFAIGTQERSVWKKSLTIPLMVEDMMDNLHGFKNYLNFERVLPFWAPEEEVKPAKIERQPAQVYQIKVTLDGSKLPIWRRIQVGSATTLSKLHQTLQSVMGWDDYHLHQFIIGGQYYGDPTFDEFGELSIINEKGNRLDQLVAQPGSKFIYEYDFGDGWEHILVVEKFIEPEPGIRYPTCVKGNRACPPEDVGGMWGYADYLEAIADPDHPEHEEMLAWRGPVDSESFDIDAVNQELAKL